MSKFPLQFKICDSLSEVSALVDYAYNAPASSDGESLRSFETEYKQAHDIVRQHLDVLGTVDSFGEADFSMGPPYNSHRAIGIGIYSKKMFRSELIYSLKDALGKLTEDYLIYIDGEYKVGMGTLYICLRGGSNEVIGYAPRSEWLLPFGFKQDHSKL